MNIKIRDTLRYILKNYPYPSDLSKTRITKLVYLSDWLMVQNYHRQITDIKWYFDHYGPYVSDVLDEADDDKEIRINETESAFGSVKYIVEPKRKKESLLHNSLTDDEIIIIDKVINDTKELTWNDFISYVYSTPPINKSNKYKILNLLDYIE